MAIRALEIGAAVLVLRRDVPAPAALIRHQRPLPPLALPGFRIATGSGKGRGYLRDVGGVGADGFEAVVRREGAAAELGEEAGDGGLVGEDVVVVDVVVLGDRHVLRQVFCLILCYVLFLMSCRSDVRRKDCQCI